MLEIESLEKRFEKISQILGVETVLENGLWHLEKSRKVEAFKSDELYVSLSLALSFTIQLGSDDQLTINQTEIFLLPEELAVFMDALIKHPIAFPISYSQQLTMERGMHCIRITSHEAPENFVQRLSDALHIIQLNSTHLG